MRSFVAKLFFILYILISVSKPVNGQLFIERYWVEQLDLKYFWTVGFSERQIPNIYPLRQTFVNYYLDEYKLVIIPPTIEKDPKPGPIKRPTFHIRDDSGELVAFFNPWGTAACYKEEFKHFFDRMVKEINQAAKDALEEFEGI